MRPKLILAALALPQTSLTLVAAWGLRDILLTLAKVYDDPDARTGLLIGAIALAIWFVASLLAAVGLWRRRNGARWLAAVINLPVPLLLLLEWLLEGEKLDADEWSITLVMAVLAIFYALPITGRLLRRPPAA
jgi:hypothetical protein